MSLGDRLKAARKAANLTQTELAEKAGLRWQSLVANVETRGQCGTTHIAKFAKALGVSPLWLETGEGPRNLAEPDPPAYFPDDESRLLRAFRIAPPDLRRNLLRQADGILEDANTPFTSHWNTPTRVPVSRIWRTANVIAFNGISTHDREPD